MTPEQWQKVERVLQGALDLPAPERSSFLNTTCSDDEQLLHEATALLEAHDQAGEFMEEPAITQDAQVLLGDIAPQLGREIGPFKIIRPLGAGGMSEVFLAQDTRLDRLVALKILPDYFAADDERLRRFQREARAASALNHPNILTIYDIGESDGIYFIATEFIDGLTIRQLLAQGDMSLGETLAVAEQVASALVTAHAEGIIHRDIKPENIMRRADGLVKILDFGIAKLIEPEEREHEAQVTEAGLLVGTVNYMSPEQARGLTVDARTDIWSLGVVLYEMCNQRLPFKGATRMDTIVEILERDVPPFVESAQDRAPLDPVIHRCLQKKAADRFSSANELLGELERVRARASTQSFPTTPDRALPPPSRPGYFWSLVGLVVILLVSSFAVVLYRRGNGRVTSQTPSANLKLYTEMSEAEQLAFIRDQEQRISAMMGDRPGKLNDEALGAIKRYVDRYASHTQRTESHESLNDLYGRAPGYVPLISRSFAARKVPVIIGIYLPVIESAYTPCYENSFGSKGLFQFLPQTARLYGVAPDEMCDAEKMAPAAAHYMADHMAELGDDAESMTLVLLSYNHGASWVRTALRELRDTSDYERNFWTLFAHRNELDESFRREGAGYVPNFFAAAIIGENPQNFGLTLPPLSSLAKTAN
ncbi:MAG TPA: serine/threonine-protein kinase [Pyrinomonadaceae bacterium]|nr:serine/threonine-protein kinase [Pyrinomonadaceae bacterium]